MNRNIIEVLFIPLFLLLVVFPVIALVAHLDWTGTVKTFHDVIFWSSVKNTIFAAFAAAILGCVLAIGFGYYHLFHRESLVYKVANLFNDLPIALPHTVAGLALLLAFGRKTCSFFGDTGLAFTMTALVLAMFFVSYPLCARAIASGVDQTEKEIIDVARTLGDNPLQAYFHVVLPVMGEALFSGCFCCRSVY